MDKASRYIYEESSLRSNTYWVRLVSYLSYKLRVHWYLIIISLRLKKRGKNALTVLDSMHTDFQWAAQHLRKYLAQEWKTKRNTERRFDEENFPAHAPDCPKQEGMSDCGVYMLHFAELFANNPHVKIGVIECKTYVILKPGWFSQEDIAKKRKQIFKTITRLTKNSYKEAQKALENIRANLKLISVTPRLDKIPKDSHIEEYLTKGSYIVLALKLQVGEGIKKLRKDYKSVRKY